MTTLAKILVTFCIALLFCSCNIVIDGITGTGEIIKKEKVISENFNTIKASRGLDVILINSNDHKIVVEANENLHDHIEISVDDNVLKITADKNIYRAGSKKVYVSYQILTKIIATSGADVTARQVITQETLDIKATSGADIDLQVKANNLSSSVTSGAMINLTGKVNTHKASATSGADLKSHDLVSLVTEAKATSGATIKIYAKKEFTGKATSGAGITYYGQPERVSEDENSGGNIRRM